MVKLYHEIYLNRDNPADIQVRDVHYPQQNYQYYLRFLSFVIISRRFVKMYHINDTSFLFLCILSIR